MMNWTPPAFKSVVYVPASQEEVILSKVVQFIQIYAYQLGIGTANKGAQHWVLHLQTGVYESICINMQPSYSQPATTEAAAGGSKGQMVVSLLHPFSISDDASVVQSYSFSPARPNTTVRDMINSLTHHGRDKYDFNADGVGCRRWLSDTLDLWAQPELGYCSQQNANTSKSFIEKHWPSGAPSPLKGGGYY
jgi:hypothetical protein